MIMFDLDTANLKMSNSKDLVNMVMTTTTISVHKFYFIKSTVPPVLMVKHHMFEIVLSITDIIQRLQQCLTQIISKLSPMLFLVLSALLFEQILLELKSSEISLVMFSNHSLSVIISPQHKMQILLMITCQLVLTQNTLWVTWLQTIEWQVSMDPASVAMERSVISQSHALHRALVYTKTKTMLGTHV